MDLIEMAEKNLEILAEVIEGLDKCISGQPDKKEAVKPYKDEADKIHSAIKAALEGWEEHHRIDPLHKDEEEWRHARYELIEWQKRYRRKVYQPARELDIELPLLGNGEEASPLKKEAAGSVDIQYTTIGEEICIDRRWECQTFLRMLNRDRQLPQHILAFQVPGRQGKSRLLRRYERFCEEAVKAGQAVLYARVDFRDRPLTPHSLASNILQKVVDNAEADAVGDKLPYQASEQLKAQIETIKRSARGSGQQQTTTIDEFELEALAKTVAGALGLLKDKSTLALILDTFENAGAAGDWFLKFFIPEVRDINSVIIVVAGRSGLDELKPQDQVILRDNLERLKYWQDCQKMAQLYHHLTISEKLAQHLIEKYQGDFSLIDMALQVFEDNPEFVPDVEQITGA
jgi:hypothetical protein